MFLKGISNPCKLSFYLIADALVKADGVTVDKEIELMDVYLNELNLSQVPDTKHVVIDDHIESLRANTSDAEKRIIFLELLTLAHIDGNYASEEKDIMTKILRAFEIDEDKHTEILQLIDRYMVVYNQLLNYIKGGL